MNDRINLQFPFPLGVSSYKDEAGSGIHVALVSKSNECGITLYNRSNGKLINKYSLVSDPIMGDLKHMRIPNIKAEEVTYQFYDGDHIIVDRNAKEFDAFNGYGTITSPEEKRAVVANSEYNWEDDVCSNLAYDESIMYLLHVRGFTMHSSSGIKEKGTFKGIERKIDYLKDLGVTSIILQPAYEFDEITKEEPKLNYWGYTTGYYYAPKQTYSYSNNAANEFKTLVKKLHNVKMEIIMQFYFPTSILQYEIINILRFWRCEYHIDGFQIMGANLPLNEILTDPILSNTKLIHNYIPCDEIYDYEETPVTKNLAICNDEYMFLMRRFLKGEEGVLYDAMKCMRENHPKYAQINYFSNYNALTMWDMVTYEGKHNEENGEFNKDGNDYNCSWNCGIEGPSRKKVILEMRKKQYLNAMILLFLSQGTPLLFMGDEFANSQNGNNNPYCQDNLISWLNWNDRKKNDILYKKVKSFIDLRRENKIFHLSNKLKIMDYKSYGYPDISYHSEEAWKAEWTYHKRYIGVLYCNQYSDEKNDGYWYLAINMHWEPHELAMPRLPKNKTWALYTTNSIEADVEIREKNGVDIAINRIAPRSIYIYKEKERRE